MNAEELAALRDELVRTTVGRCWDGSAFYRGKLQAAGVEPGDIAGVDDLNRLPILLAKDDETQKKIRAAVKLGLTAFTLEWDGHVQAMTGKREFWGGVADLNMRQPKVRLS